MVKHSELKGEFRGYIYDSILDTIGATPSVRLTRIATEAGINADIIGKCEFFNPLASVKDRIGLSMINAAEEQAINLSNSVLVEPTSGNTGIALAFVCAAKGYRLILTMPDSMSIERRKMLSLLGVKLELTPASDGMRGAISRAEEIVAENKDAIMLQQFENPANPEIHRLTTAQEIWKDTRGKVDVLISGVGTGGTLTGCATVLKEKNANIFKLKNTKIIIFYNSGDKKKIKFLKSKKAKLINVKLEKNGEFDLKKVMSILYQNNIRFLLVEGGDQFTNKMLDKNLFNEFYLIKTDNKLRQSGKLNIKKIVYKLSKKFRIKSNINQYFDKNRITRFI